MLRFRFLFAVPALFVANQALAAPDAPPGRPITLQEALSMAESRSLDMEIARDNRDATVHDTRAAAGQMLAQLKVTGSYLDWDSPYGVAFPGLGFFEIRKKQTTLFDASAYQPLTGLYAAGEATKAASQLSDAADADLASVREEVRLDTNVVYLRLLEAIDLEKIASDAISDVQEQVRITRSGMEAGNRITLDLLRTQARLAEVKQEELQRKANVGRATAALDTLIGLPPTTTLAPTPVENTLPTLPTDVDAAIVQAVAHRPEMAFVRARTAAAESGHQAAIGAVLPSIGVVAQYENQSGIAFGEPIHTWTVGGSLSWNIWDWGHQYELARAAGSRARAAEADSERRQLTISLDVTNRFLEAQAAFPSVEVAHERVGLAEEAYRVMKSRYENGLAQTSDILDTQHDLVNARAADALAQYDYRIAYETFVRAAAMNQGKDAGGSTAGK